MNLGNRIKELRKMRGITQGELAENVGVSFQAVSKWENNIALPDITLAPVLASYFCVSMDELFDFSTKKIQDDIERITAEAFKFRKSNSDESKRILEIGLAKYPENDILLNNLLYVLDYSKDPDRTIEISNKIIEKTVHSDVKCDALRFLAYAYKEKGDLESAQAAIEQIPEIYFTKLTEIAYISRGEKKRESAEKQKWISFENLLQMMCKLAEYYEEIGEYEKSAVETENAIKLTCVLKNNSFDNYTEFFRKQKERLESKMRKS